MPDVLEVRLYGPSGDDLRHVGQLEVHLIVSNLQRLPRECDLIPVEAANVVGKPRVDDTRTELVVWPTRHHAGEDNTATRIDIDQIAIRRRYRASAKTEMPPSAAAPAGR